MIALHVVAAVRLARAVLPAMVDHGRGTIIAVSSLGAFYTASRYVTYSATKSYLNMFALGLAEELAGTGVRVQALCPGLTRTEFLSTPEYAEFDYSEVPELFWTSSEQVVDESLAALRTGRVVVVPGLANRLFVGLLDSPAGPLVRRAIALASRAGSKGSGGDPSKSLY